MTRAVSKHIDMERDGLAIKAEYLQTDQWAIEAILDVEILTDSVIDPCCGDGRMAKAAERRGYSKVIATDLNNWGYGQTGQDFLLQPYCAYQFVRGATVFMNPPFSLACQFVDQARDLGARKIVCFQRTVWKESRKRKAWWEKNPPNRTYECGDRAYCWYGTIPIEKRGGGGMNQPHSWFVWESGHPAGTLRGTLWDKGRD